MRRAPLFAASALLSACLSPSAEEAATSRAGLACTPLAAGMVVTRDTTLCAGPHRVAIASGEAAITIDADDVTLRCDGAVIENRSGFGADGAPPSVGIAIGARRGVRVEGCGARGFRYGLVARGARDLVLEDVHLDDNFSDASREWVQDTVQGGGVRLEGVAGALVTRSSFARNWNGIEVRRSKDVKVTRSKGDHATNWGAFVDHSEDTELSDDDFDWGLRWGRARPVTEIPLEERTRDNWFGQDTKDSGGIVVDGGSARTRISRCSVRYGGDGIFVRAITGSCPTETWVEDNDVSFSPHFAMETWCDGDTYVGNVSRHSDNGFWLGGSSNTVVLGNTIEKSRVYALSIMENQGRHVLVQDNTFRDNRAGIMVTGKNRWPGQSLDSASWPNMAGSSHVVIQRNAFFGTELADVAASYTRSLVLASNCTDGRDTEIALGPEVLAVETIGRCGAGVGADPPEVRVSAPAVALPRDAVDVTATTTATSDAPSDPKVTWLVTPAAPRFPSGVLPPAPLAVTGAGAQARVTFARPGLYDVDATVHDGSLAGLFAAPLRDAPRRPGWTRIAVPPQGRRIGERAEDFGYDCHGGACTTSIAAAPGLDGEAVRLVSDAPSRVSAVVPRGRDLGAPIRATTRIAFFLRAKNPKVWQRSMPEIVVFGGGGSIRLRSAVLDRARPSAGNVLKFGEAEWVFVDAPLAGGDGYERTVSGRAPRTIDAIAIGSETMPGAPIELVIDDLTLYDAE